MILNKKLENYWLILLSLPSWECGLKWTISWKQKISVNRHSLRGSVDWNLKKIWSPIRGVCHSLRGSVDWNFFTTLYDTFTLSSLPSWECGLKSQKKLILLPPFTVTPFVGVWIEITHHPARKVEKNVTPFVGVWIEIITVTINPPRTICHSLRGSVDWNYFDQGKLTTNTVTPFVGVWIEITESMTKRRKA